MKNAKRKRYVQVGIGGRSYMYADAIRYRYPETCELAAICDVNEGRMALRNRRFAEPEPGSGRAPLPPVTVYPAADFDRMLAVEKPDAVIVTTKDCHHHEYIVRAMKAGCDAVTEKPMTTDAAKCREILAAMRTTGRSLRVTFNYRYSPVRSQVKRLLMDGTIGAILSMDFFWNLDTSHGADYFRRWHRNKANSGGLLVHKATHHFDLVNWWTATFPVEVAAFGARRFYTPEQADRLGLADRAARCRGCPESAKCPFFLDLSKPGLKELYLDQERYDGYFRDKCVFSPEIDIEDSMSVSVKYNSGAVMSYALNAFMPWEGYSISFNGTKGRIEHTCVESVYVSGDGTIPGQMIEKGTSIVVHPHFGPSYDVPIEEAKGGHGGGDDPLLDDVFSPNPPADPLFRSAGAAEGSYSILTGIAANESIRTGKVVRIAELVPGIPAPNYGPAPAR